MNPFHTALAHVESGHSLQYAAKLAGVAHKARVKLEKIDPRWRALKQHYLKLRTYRAHLNHRINGG